jgi:hypothetical protein
MRKRSGKKNKNGAAMKKEDGCHKNKKMGQRTKRGRKVQKQDGRKRLASKKNKGIKEQRENQKREAR